MREEIKMKKKVCVNVFINAGVYHQGGYDCSAWTLLELGHSSQGFKVNSLWIQSEFKANFSVLCLCHTLWIKKLFNSQIFLENSFAMTLSTWNFCRTLSSVSLRHLDPRFSENLCSWVYILLQPRLDEGQERFFVFPRNFTWICLSWKQCFIVCIRSIVKWANCWCEFPHLFVFISTKLSKCCW